MARWATYLLADLGELLVAVVGLVGQSEPALEEVDDVALGVAVVVVDVGAEQAAAAVALELAEEAGHVAYVAQRRRPRRAPAAAA